MTVVHKPACLLLLASCVVVLGCGEADSATQSAASDQADAATELATPRQSLEYYLASLRRGDLEGVQRVMLRADNFHLPGPLPLDSFHVTRQDTLTAEQAAEFGFVPSPQEGDVVFDVREYLAGEGERMYTYHLREVDGTWRIYAHAAWGVDAFEEDEL